VQTHTNNVTIDRTALWDKVGYHPHEKQLLFHDSKARFKIPVCGRRFGKSRMASSELLPKMFKKNARYWIVGPTYTLGEKEFRYLWDDIVINLGLGPHLKRKAYNVRTGEMYIEMPWGTRVDVVSADHPDGLVGEGLDGLIVSEAAKQKRSVWEKYLRPALADKLGWAIFPSTPEGYNWYYDLYQIGQDPEFPDYESWNFPAWENPYVYPGGFEDPEIQSQLRTPDDPWFWQELGADFRSFVGKIYTEWDDSKHIIDGYEYNPDWPNYVFFDFGFTNPFVCLDVQIDPSDNIYIWREYYVPEKSVYKHVSELLARPNPPKYAIRVGFGDAADPSAIETLSVNFAPTYGSTDAKDVNTGIQWVKKFLSLDDTGKPHLFVDRKCDNTIFEFQNYRTMQTAREGENPKEDPKKWSDHAMDALRYGIMHLYVLGARYHLADVVAKLTRPPEQIVEAPVELVDFKAPPDTDPVPSEHFFTRESSSVFTTKGRDVW
jgi:hypothetical protein